MFLYNNAFNKIIIRIIVVGKKSALQVKLEKEGWMFLTNTLIRQFGKPYTNQHLEAEYKKNGYNNVLVDNSAFDVEGNPIKNSDYRAIYIKMLIPLFFQHSLDTGSISEKPS